MKFNQLAITETNEDDKSINLDWNCRNL